MPSVELITEWLSHDLRWHSRPQKYTFDGRLQAGKQEEVCRSQIRGVRRVIKHSYHLLSQEFVHMDHTVCRDIIMEQHPFSSPVQL